MKGCYWQLLRNRTGKRIRCRGLLSRFATGEFKMSSQERWCVVTGGRGFAARHLVEMLISYEMYCVRIAELGPSIWLEQYEEEGPLGKALKVGRAQYVSVDLRDKTQVLKAFQGAEVVFHMAAPDSSINNYNLQRSVNVEGTKNVIESCVALQVNRLIYTSSPSVVFDGVHGIINGDESLSYPVKPLKLRGKHWS